MDATTTITPTVSKIMIIRHAEKPVGKTLGVTAEGANDKEALIVQGWQRAGGIVNLLAPGGGQFQNAALAMPKTIIASWKSAKHGSQRPLETVTPLANKLGITPITFVNDSATADDSVDTSADDASNSTNTGVTDAVAAALVAKGMALIAWQHEDIPLIANTIASASGLPVTAVFPSTWPPPKKWPSSRFDLVWVFDIVGSNPPTGWTFTQVPQLLLAGDLDSVITSSGS
jgi:hypothetical protein